MDATTYPLSTFQTMGISPDEIIQPASGAVHVDNDGTGLDKLMAIAAMVADRQDGVGSQMNYNTINVEEYAAEAPLSIQDKTYSQIDEPTVDSKKGSKKKKSPSKSKKRRRSSPGPEVPKPKMGRPPGTGPGRKLHPCEKCVRIFPNAAKLREHVRVVHDGMLLRCEICNATMKWAQNMTVHMYTKHGIGDPPQRKVIKRECEQCKIKFPSNQKLNEHMENVHYNYDHFRCPVCKMQFKSSHSLLLHKKMHTGTDLGFQRCGTCHLRYKMTVMLTRHCTKYDHRFDPEWYTQDELTFECYRCHKIFSNYTSLATHVQEANKYKECYINPNIRCNQCKIQFKERKKFVRHMKESHGKRILKKNTKGSNPNKKPKQCKICGKTLSWQTEMRYHINMHKGIKSFKCDLCDYASYFPSSVRMHRKTHFGEMKYQCRTCGKGFKARSLWRACEFMHTGKKPVECKKCGIQFVSDEAIKGHKKCVPKRTNPAVNMVESDANKITNQSVLNLMMRGGHQMAESVDPTAIADFKKPKPVKTIGRPKRLKEPKQSKSCDDEDALANIESLEASDPSDDIAQLEKMVQTNQSQVSNSQTMASSASKDQQTTSPASTEKNGQSEKANSETENHSGGQPPKVSCSESASSTSERDTIQRSTLANQAGNTSSTSTCVGTEQTTHGKRVKKKYMRMPGSVLPASNSIAKPVWKSKPTWKTLRNPCTRGKLTREELKQEYDHCDWREKTHNSFIYWKEVSVEEVIESVNAEKRLNSKSARLPDQDIFDDIVFA